jgi:hypothetical protein
MGYLAVLRAPPLAGASRKERQEYYLRTFSRSSDIAGKYYQEHLFADITARLHQQVAKIVGRVRVSLLVTVCSVNPELIGFAVASIRPSRCLILHTHDRKDEARKVADSLSGTEVNLRRISNKEDLSLGREIRRAVSRVAGKTIMFDLTPGKKPHTLAMLQAALAFRNGFVMYLHHSLDYSQRPSPVIPFSEWYETWPAGHFTLA